MKTTTPCICYQSTKITNFTVALEANGFGISSTLVFMQNATNKMVVQLYSCPSLGACAWRGLHSDIIPHFETDHIELLLIDNEFRLAIQSFSETEAIPYEYAINYLLSNHGAIYLVQVNVINGKATLQIRYSGSAQDATRWRYSVQVRSGKMVQFSNTQSSTFYSAVGVRPGMITIDAQFLRNAWKVDDFLTCRIYFEDLGGVQNVFKEPSKRQFLRISKSMEEITLDTDESVDSKHEPVTKTMPLSRSASEQSPSRLDRKSLFRSSKMFKRKSICKSDQSLFYTDPDFLGTGDAKNLLDLAEDRISLLKDYQCYQCKVYIAGPIYRCCNDHSTCHACMEEFGSCVCSAGLSTDQRSDVLEKTRDVTKLPCRFKGCSVSALGAELQLHQVQCSHCVYICPECKACIGKYGEVEKHFKIVHPSVKRVTNLENPFPGKMAFLVLHPQGVFYCKSSEGANCVDWQVEHCGHVNIYFECEVITKKNSFALTSSKEKNVLKRSTSSFEKKQKSGAVLRIKVYQPHI